MYFESNDCFIAFLKIIFILFLKGIIKALVGLTSSLRVAQFGLGLFQDPQQSHYFEKELENRQIIFDDNGKPIHPDRYDINVS